MAIRMIWHDKRLLGTPPAIAQNTFEVDATVSIRNAIGWVGAYARSQGGLDELMIMCHGFEGNMDLSAQASTQTTVGGFGLQLCKEGLTLYTAGLLEQWKGQIQKVTVYACAPADTGPGNAGTSGDGKRLMGEMALHSGAEVIAARDTQTYTYSPINFGAWEGPVYSFSPDTGAGKLCNPGPMQ